MKSIIGMLKGSPKFHFDNLFWDNPQPYEEIILYQIGDMSCDSGYEIGNHKQECYEISYIVSGTGHYFTNDKAHKLEKGDIYICLPGEIHNGIADSIDPFRYFYVGFDFLNDSKKLTFFKHIQKMFDLIKYPVAKDIYGLDNIFVGIFKELINNKEHSSIMIKTYLNQIIIMTYRSFFDRWEEEYDPQHSFGDNSAQITYQIINYIDMNLFSMKVLSEIGEELGYNYSYLSHTFSKETGFTIQEYFNQQKFEKATELLKSGKLTVTEIAEKLNYQSVHSFSKAFKNNVGVSPAQYQDLYRGRVKDIN